MDRRDTVGLPGAELLGNELRRGWVDDQNLAALYAGATAVVQASLYEGLGLLQIAAAELRVEAAPGPVTRLAAS
jgi:hypothetical protein